MAFFLSPSQIEIEAERFLAEQDPDRQLPVPIENIVELRLRIEIIPVDGLYKDSGIEGFLHPSLTSLYVDLSMSDHRIRFTYAHEMGHLVMHKDQIKSAQRRSADGWKDMVLSRSEEYGPLEIQAGMFAARLLMPTADISAAYEAAKMRAIEREPRLKGVDDETIASFAAADVARRFDVSAEAAGYRLLNWLREPYKQT